MNKKSIGADALETLKACNKIYLENYTVNFPYTIKELQISVGLKIEPLDRSKVEGLDFLDEAKKKDVALLVYGDALSATTHITIIQECRKRDIEYKVFHNASILTAISETGLQLYKFGKTASMPNWEEHTNKPTSFMNYIKENQSIKAHTLLLTDIGLELKDVINQLQEAEKLSIEDDTKLFAPRSANAREQSKNKRATARQLIPKKIIVVSNAGTENQKIFYETLKNLKDKNIKMPFCLIIPGEMHFIEEEALEEIKE